MIDTRSEYQEFLDRKTQLGTNHGFDMICQPDTLFDFQRELVAWATRKGRCALFADCGLGKTPMQLAWANNVAKASGRRVLILTPLAVSHQTIGEGEKFGFDVTRCGNGDLTDQSQLVVTNYERLHYFDPSDFAGVVCDESSILKNFDGARKSEITTFMRKVPYRLLCTATAAPNDYIELGTSSEALGELGHVDMLNRFFTNRNRTSDTRGHYTGFSAPRAWNDGEWHFKPHAEQPFWRWVCSWARAMRKPSDLGFDDRDFILPPLEVKQTVIAARQPREGMLFDIPAMGFHEERETRRRTIVERCEVAASKVVDTGNPAMLWCHLNAEGDLLEKLIPDAVQVSGQDSDESKESKLTAFQRNQIRVLIIKPKIGAYGLNLQHCAHVVYFPSHSYEQYYQAVRRCWRFGQQRPVIVDLVSTDADERMVSNLARKAEAADKMFSDLVAHMNDELRVDRGREYPNNVEVPSWL
jgi:hypothetical protein